MPFIDSLLKKAVSQDGVREEPLGSNKGPKVTEFQRRAGYSFPVPWCMCFLYWCIDEVCIDLEIENPTMRTGDCDTFLNWGHKVGLVHNEPAVGDLGFVMKSEHDAVHVFLVTDVKGSVIHTIEGNTNNDGNREGYRVCARTRSVKPTFKFVRVADVMAKPVPAETFELVGPSGSLGDLEAMHGTAWAPIRKISKALGMKSGATTLPVNDPDISWDAEDQTVTVKGKAVPGQVMLKDGVSYVPIRKLAACLGYQVSVQGRTIRLS